MLPEEDIARVREHIARAIAQRIVEETAIDWTAVRQLERPILRVQACLQDGSKQTANQCIPGPIITVSGVDQVAHHAEFLADPASAAPHRPVRDRAPESGITEYP
jgi:hypothetical protein